MIVDKPSAGADTCKIDKVGSENIFLNQFVFLGALASGIRISSRGKKTNKRT